MSKKEEEPELQIGLIDIVFPFFIPIKGLVWVAKNIKKAAESEITDESAVREKLLELQMHYEMAEITEEEYDKREAKLMAKLEAIRKYKEEQSGQAGQNNKDS